MGALGYGVMDFSVIDGRRTDEKQHEYFLSGKSKVDAGHPRAMHNKFPVSLALDLAPGL